MRIINKNYLKYYAKAQTVQSVHSPFLYKLLIESIENVRMYNMLIDIEQLERSKEISFKTSVKHLGFIFHWLRILKPKSVLMNAYAPDELAWIVKRMKIEVLPIETTNSSELDDNAFAIVSYDYANSIEKLLNSKCANIFIVCIGISKPKYDELLKSFDYTVNMYDIHLLINRSDIKTNQHFTIIEHKRKLSDTGFFPK